MPGLGAGDAEIYHWRALGGMAALVGAPTRDLAQLARERFAARAAHGDGELGTPLVPALGAGLQAVHETSLEVNVLPAQRRGRQERRFTVLTFFLAGFVLFLGLTWAVSVILHGRWILAQLAARSSEMDPQVEAVVQAEEEARQLEERLSTLLSAGYHRRVLPVLKDVSEVLPVEVYLNRVLYQAGGVDLSGVATKSAADLVALLERSPCLDGVSPKAPFARTPFGETFTLGAQVAQCG